MTPPQTLLAGRYRLLEPIGQGGMGRVWLAMDEFLTRQVAVKEVVAPQGLTAAEVRDMGARALREARAAARLTHPNVVTVYDIVVTDTAPWIVMEYLPSRSLYEVVSQDGPLPVPAAARVGLAVLTALRAAHAVGVLHRDVKPGNVLMDESGRIVLTDFGLATIVGDPSVTRSGMIIGSPSYMAPERARDAEAGAAADLWSLGATLYFAVEGRSPYERTTALATVAALASEDPDPSLRSGRLKPVLNGLLRRDPAARLDSQTLERMLRVVARSAAVKPGVVTNVGQRAFPRPAPAAAPAVVPADSVPAASVPAGSMAAGSVAAGAGGAADSVAVNAVGTPAAVPPLDAPSPPTKKLAPSPTPTPTLPPGSQGGPPALALQSRQLWQKVRVDRRAWAAAIVVAVLVVAAIAWAVATSSDAGSRDPAAGPAVAPTSSAARPTSSAPPTTAASPGPPSVLALPAGWHMYTDPTGFSVAVDASWIVSKQGSIVYFRESNGGRVLGIDQTNKPIADPVADWTGKEQYRTTHGDFPDYKRVRLTAVDYFKKAADWEFTYLLNGARVHVNNRGFIVSATKAYGMWWSTPADRWDEYRPQLELIQRSFDPAG